MQDKTNSSLERVQDISEKNELVGNPKNNSLTKPLSEFRLTTKVTDTLTENLERYLEVRKKLIAVKQEHQQVKERIINDHGEDGARILKAFEVADEFRDFYTNVS